MIDDGFVQPVALCDAEKLPFPDRYFDRVCVAFGLRNMTDKAAALAEMRRVLRPGGRLLVLEFSRVHPSLARLYDTYSFEVLPRVGKFVTQDADSYRYLAESIRMHPDQSTLSDMLVQAGFDHVVFSNLSAGVVALHEGVVLE
jgi:demethylmenaquinone methyltransferase/2-methoxy-6-polyprenyl-1,4-benzoquinol methylase